MCDMIGRGKIDQEHLENLETVFQCLSEKD